MGDCFCRFCSSASEAAEAASEDIEPTYSMRTILLRNHVAIILSCRLLAKGYAVSQPGLVSAAAGVSLQDELFQFPPTADVCLGVVPDESDKDAVHMTAVGAEDIGKDLIPDENRFFLWHLKQIQGFKQAGFLWLIRIADIQGFYIFAKSSDALFVIVGEQACFQADVPDPVKKIVHFRSGIRSVGDNCVVDVKNESLIAFSRSFS